MKKHLPLILVIVIALILFYLILPVINYGFVSLPVILLISLFVGFIFSGSYQNLHTNKPTIKPGQYTRAFLYGMGVIVIYLTVFPLATSLPMFRSGAYRNLIGKVHNGSEISNHIAPISLNKIRVVDERLAYLLGEKILGSEPALGSKTEIGRFTIQKVAGELYWVAPLLHSGFFKWLNSTEGTDGYVLVSATNERDVRLVQQVNGKDLKIKYQPGAYFGSDIERHLYLNGYVATGMADFNFEIDDAGNPYWVVTTYKKEIGFAGNNASGVLIVDAQTGYIKEYTIAGAPLWADRIQPLDFIQEQLNDWGEYVKGYWNFSDEDKLMTTEGLTLIYGEDNKSYWYTGLSSVGKEESAVGFVLVDTRTKEATLYNQSGATEYAAQSSAEGKVQEKGYKASLPIPYNINNIPMYIMTLKDEGGLVKMYAMVAISDYTIVGVGNTMRETLTAFKNVYNMADNKINVTARANKKVVNAVVDRIQSDIKSGNSFYYFTVKDYNKIFVGSSQLSNELPVTVAGDSIIISFDVDNEDVIDVSAFDNLRLGKPVKK